MNQKQRDSIKFICKKLGRSKTMSVIDRLNSSDKDHFSVSDIQEWTRLNTQHARELLELMDSFECKESFCIALQLQDEMYSEQFNESQNTRLVMTGPISGNSIRYTQGNFKKIIETAEKEIILVGYVFKNIKGQLDPILDSLVSATKRGISIKIFFQRGLSTKSLKEVWKASKSSEMPELFIYKPKEKNSVLHAKVLIKDDDTILVTSANLTGSAMEKNIEIGMLHHGELVRTAKQMLYDLIDKGYMVKSN